MTWSYSAQTVKDQDPARFLVTLHQQKVLQEPIFTLLAFNCEISKIASYVSNEMLGHIRFQWWREAIDEVYNSDADTKTIRKHEVVQALHSLKQTLPANLLHLIIDTHVHDLTNEPFGTIDELEKYAANTDGTILRLIGYVLNKKLDSASERALNHLGVAWHLSGLALTTATEKDDGSLETNSEALAQEAWSHLERSRQADTSEFNPYATHINARLKALSKAGYKPSVSLNQRISASMPLKLWWASVTK